MDTKQNLRVKLRVVIRKLNPIVTTIAGLLGVRKSDLVRFSLGEDNLTTNQLETLSTLLKGVV